MKTRVTFQKDTDYSVLWRVIRKLKCSLLRLNAFMPERNEMSIKNSLYDC